MKQKTYLSDLNEFMQQNDSLITVINQLSIPNAESVIQQRNDLIHQYIISTQNIDTISIKTAQHIENINYSIENLNQFVRHQPVVKSNLEQKSKELKQLNYIVKNGFGNRSEYASLLSEEKKKMHRLRQNALSTIRSYRNGMQDFDTSIRSIQKIVRQ